MLVVLASESIATDCDISVLDPLNFIVRRSIARIIFQHINNLKLIKNVYAFHLDIAQLIYIFLFKTLLSFGVCVRVATIANKQIRQHHLFQTIQTNAYIFYFRSLHLNAWIIQWWIFNFCFAKTMGFIYLCVYSVFKNL